MRKRWKWTALGSTALISLLVVVWRISAFLAINSPVDGDILVVEGWMWDSSAMSEAADEFKRGRYEQLVTIGGPDGKGGGTTDQMSSAELAAMRLRELGVEGSRIVVLALPRVKWHQTYSSAVALRDWLIRSRIETTGVNVFTLGTHARKSLVLFRRALGSGINVGVIAGTEDTYDPGRWWLSARGIYVVSRKTLGYLYAVSWPFLGLGLYKTDTSGRPTPTPKLYIPVCFDTTKASTLCIGTLSALKCFDRAMPPSYFSAMSENDA